MGGDDANIWFEVILDHFGTFFSSLWDYFCIVLASYWFFLLSF